MIPISCGARIVVPRPSAYAVVGSVVMRPVVSRDVRGVAPIPTTSIDM